VGAIAPNTPQLLQCNSKIHRTGRINLRLPGERNLHYRLELQANSLEEWLERWLCGELKYQLSWPDELELDTFSVRPLFEAHSTGEAGENKD
jgi:hypothetical protein